jgi:hypothetical protein
MTLKAQVLRTYSEQTDDEIHNTSIVEDQMASLEQWLTSLPPAMQIPTLFDTEIDLESAARKGALLLAYATFQGSIMLLHRPALIAGARQSLTSDAPPSHHPIGSNPHQSPLDIYHDRCVTAARNSVRIFNLVEFGTTHNMHVRCWLSLYEIFTACSVLLYSLALAFHRHAPLLSGSASSSSSTTTTTTGAGVTLAEDILRTQDCFRMLSIAAHSDAVAQKLVARLRPVQVAVLELHAAAVELSGSLTGADAISGGPTTTREQAGLRGAEIDTEEMLRRALEVLEDPFGHGRERGLEVFGRDGGTEKGRAVIRGGGRRAGDGDGDWWGRRWMC